MSKTDIWCSIVTMMRKRNLFERLWDWCVSFTEPLPPKVSVLGHTIVVGCDCGAQNTLDRKLDQPETVIIVCHGCEEQLQATVTAELLRPGTPAPTWWNKL